MRAALARAVPPAFTGRRLDDVLRVLQAEGLAIVFSSEVVTPAMRVSSEPRGTTPRQQLDDLLAPHGLEASPGPGRTLIIVRSHVRPTRSARVPERSAAPDLSAPSHAAFADRVTVLGSIRQTGTSAPATLEGGTLDAVASPLDADGFDAVRTLPGISAFDDLHSDFSVRGSPFRQVSFLVDGVPAKWLQHAVYGRGDIGTLAMFGNGAIERATLQAGAYPRRHGDSLGAELQMTLREGSRENTRLTAAGGGLSAFVIGEGPIAGGRGSWIAGVRNSYRSWPPRRPSPDGTGFAFADAHLKVAFDASPTERLTLTAIAGRSAADTADEPSLGSVASGLDRAGLVTVAARSAFGASTVVGQQAFVVGQALESTLRTAGNPAGTRNLAVGYRSELLRAVRGGVLETGFEISRWSATRPGDDGSREARSITWTTPAAYVDFSRTSGPLSVEAGVRASGSTLVDGAAIAPWVLGAWRFHPGWMLNASAGGSRQFADADAISRTTLELEIPPERATHVDVGVSRELGRLRWQVTAFSRVENDLLRTTAAPLPAVFRIVPGEAARPLTGSSRGIELVVARDAAATISGWLAYTCAASELSDPGAGVSAWRPLDRRHAFTAVGRFRFGERTSAGLILRAASGTPLAIRVPSQGSVLEPGKGDRRSPAYARLDARIERIVLSGAHRVMLFGEALNALNRDNDPARWLGVLPSADGMRSAGVPRRFSAGIEMMLAR